MACDRCLADPQPKHFGNPRRCAFTPEGVFTPDNWNCATIQALLELARTVNHEGNDESMQMLYVDPKETRGWLVITRYKYRGKTSAAVVVGDQDPVVLTLSVAEAIISGNWPTSADDVETTPAIEAVALSQADGHADPVGDITPPAPISQELLAALDTDGVH